MISNQILQNTIDGVKGITKIDLSVVDADGNVLAETAGDSEDYCATVKTFADSPADSQAILGYQFFKVYDESQLEYIVVAKGEAEDVYRLYAACVPVATRISSRQWMRKTSLS